MAEVIVAPIIADKRQALVVQAHQVTIVVHHAVGEYPAAVGTQAGRALPDPLVPFVLESQPM